MCGRRAARRAFLGRAWLHAVCVLFSCASHGPSTIKEKHVVSTTTLLCNRRIMVEEGVVGANSFVVHGYPYPRDQRVADIIPSRCGLRQSAPKTTRAPRRVEVWGADLGALDGVLGFPSCCQAALLLMGCTAHALRHRRSGFRRLGLLYTPSGDGGVRPCPRGLTKDVLRAA